MNNPVTTQIVPNIGPNVFGTLFLRSGPKQIGTHPSVKGLRHAFARQDERSSGN